MNKKYEEDVAGFEKINSQKGLDLIENKEETVIYIGKEECPFCQLFVEKLQKVADETDTHIYYIDSANQSDMPDIKTFRSKFDIPTVPGFIYSADQTLNVISDSSISEEDIKAFMNK